MAENDIRVWNSPRGGHAKVGHFRVNASETFWRGEPVALNADGELTESADDCVNDDLLGIALENGNLTSGRDWKTDTTKVTGATIPVALADHLTLFITSNFGASSESFGSTPALADIGDEVGLELCTNVWGVNQGATYNSCRIMDVLDANFESLQINTGGTGVYVVFSIVGHQNVPDTGVVVAPAA